MTNRNRNRDRGIACFGGVLVVALSGGCQYSFNAAKDPYADRAPISTATTEGAWALGSEVRTDHRSMAAVETRSEPALVTHHPLLFEDAAHDLDCYDDGQFAWTLQDYGAGLLSLGRFAVNLAAAPISLIDTSPWVLMESDGHNHGATGRRVLCHCFDAVRAGGK